MPIPFGGRAMTVTASTRIALKTHIFATALATVLLTVVLPIARWARPAELAHLPSTPYFILLMAAIFQISTLLILLIGWSWYRLHTWTLDAHGITCERRSRPLYKLPWEQVRVVSLEWLGVHFDTTDSRRHYLGFVDSRSVREAVPVDKRWPPNPADGSDAAGDSGGREE